MKERTILTLGVAAAVVAAVCCFTPVLVWALAGLGIAAGAWLDIELLPVLAVFAAIALYGWWQVRRAGAVKEKALE